uniref:Signal recognition particle 14 kDa protein n=1 Tax=Leptobrachium leishanense TaxID=445787 RepID=A0A8C5WLP8_9ANUR
LLFLTELTRLFQKCRTTGSVYITLKKYDGRTKPVPRKGHPETFEPADNKCLLRATDGKKKISTVVSSKEVNKFQMVSLPSGRRAVMHSRKISAGGSVTASTARRSLGNAAGLRNAGLMLLLQSASCPSPADTSKPAQHWLPVSRHLHKYLCKGSIGTNTSIGASLIFV